eukprot:764582-Hanusia_phi.AAC.1
MAPRILTATAAQPIARKPRAIRKNCITRDPRQLQALFCYKESEAAKILGISLTAMKHVCRRAGIKKWPYSRSRAMASVSLSSPTSYEAILSSAEQGEQESTNDSIRMYDSRDSREACVGEAWGWDQDESPLEAKWIEWYMTSDDDSEQA